MFHFISLEPKEAPELKRRIEEPKRIKKKEEEEKK